MRTGKLTALAVRKLVKPGRYGVVSQSEIRPLSSWLGLTLPYAHIVHRFDLAVPVEF